MARLNSTATTLLYSTLLPPEASLQRGLSLALDGGRVYAAYEVLEFYRLPGFSYGSSPRTLSSGILALDLDGSGSVSQLLFPAIQAGAFTVSGGSVFIASNQSQSTTPAPATIQSLRPTPPDPARNL